MRVKDLSYFRWRISRSQGRKRQSTESAGYFRALVAEPLEERTLLDGGVDIATTTLTAIATPDPAATAKNPQSKVWQHDGFWWSVLAVNTGTWVARLDGTAWTPVLQISTTTYSADVTPVGDGTIAHVFLFRTGTSKLASLEYVPGAPGTYQFWQVRPALASIPISTGANSGTIDIDSTGRMWQTNDATSTIEVHYSDYPYSTWNGPVTLATGVGTRGGTGSVAEISALTALPNGTIGVMWSDHTTKRFGFRTHVDGADPTIWSADEVPASQSAQNIGDGMADDHLHLAVGADGALYAAVKTAYDAGTVSAPEMALLVRHPAVGIQPAYWDPLYAIDGHGTRQIDIVNNQQGYVMFAYAGETGVNDIVYKIIPLADIDPGNPTKFYSQPRQALLSGMNLKNVNSQKGAFSSDLVLIATQVVSDTNYVAGARITSTSAYYSVTKTDDDDGLGSLRQAILDSNAHPGSVITFSLSTGVHAMQLASTLPPMTSPATFEVPVGMAIEIGTASAFTLGDYTQLTKTGGGALTIAGPQSHASATTLNANAGTLNLNSDGGTNLTVNASSTVYFNSTQHLAALNITGSGAVKLSAGGGKAIVTGGLAITGSGQFDLADNSLVVQATTATKNAVLADVTAKIASGHGTSGPYWLGSGIVSSTAAANPNHLTALGVMLNAQPVFTNFAGEYVGPTSILVRYTYYGDANLSGAIDGTDYAIVDNGYNFGLSGWKNGDFDYSGSVDGTDYALIDNGTNFQNGPLTPPDAETTVHAQFRISTAGSNTIFDLTGTKFLALEDTLYPAGSEPAVWPTQTEVTHNGPGSSTNSELYPVSLVNQNSPTVKNGTIVGQMSPLAPWHIWKNLSDGDGIHAETATGVFAVDGTRIDNVEDGFGATALSATQFTFNIHDVYFSRIHDDAVENDDILSGSISNSLFETHTFLSEKGSFTNPNALVTIDNCVVELILQPHQGNDSGNYNTAGGYPYPDGLGNGSIFKFYDGGIGNGQVHVKNSVFLVNRAASSSNSSMQFAPGTYENVTVVWLGTGNYPFAAPPGVTITTNRTVHDNARAAFFAAHPQFTGGSVLSAGEMNQLAFAIAQSQMPSQEVDPLTGRPKK